MKALYALCLSLAAFAFARPAQAELEYLVYDLSTGHTETVTNPDVTAPEYHTGSEMLFVRDTTVADQTYYIGVFEVTQAQAKQLNWTGASEGGGWAYGTSTESNFVNRSLPANVAFPTHAQWKAYTDDPATLTNEAKKYINIKGGASSWQTYSSEEWYNDYLCASPSELVSNSHGVYDIYGNVAEYATDGEGVGPFYGGAAASADSFLHLNEGSKDNLRNQGKVASRYGKDHQYCGARLVYMPPKEQFYSVTVTLDNADVTETTVTVPEGMAPAELKVGTSVTVSAPTPAGWHRLSGRTVTPDSLTFTEALDAPLTFDMPAENVTIAYTSEPYGNITVEKAEMQVNGGDWVTSAQVVVGDTVTLKADEPGQYQFFSRWDGVQPGENDPITVGEELMRKETVIEAVYQYYPRVIVVGGTATVAEADAEKAFGNGYYAIGTVLTLEAQELPGYKFTAWTVSSESEVTGSLDTERNYTIGANDAGTTVTLTATYAYDESGESGTVTPADIHLGSTLDEGVYTAHPLFGWAPAEEETAILDTAGNRYLSYPYENAGLFAILPLTGEDHTITFQDAEPTRDNPAPERPTAPPQPNFSELPQDQLEAAMEEWLKEREEYLKKLDEYWKEYEAWLSSASSSSSLNTSRLLLRRVSPTTEGKRDFYLGVFETPIGNIANLEKLAKGTTSYDASSKAPFCARTTGARDYPDLNSYLTLINGQFNVAARFPTQADVIAVGDQTRANPPDPANPGAGYGLGRAERHGTDYDINLVCKTSPASSMVVAQGGASTPANVDGMEVDPYGFYGLWGNCWEASSNDAGFGGSTDFAAERDADLNCRTDVTTASYPNGKMVLALRPAIDVEEAVVIYVGKESSATAVQVAPGQDLFADPSVLPTKALSRCTGWTLGDTKIKAGENHTVTTEDDKKVLVPTWEETPTSVTVKCVDCLGPETAYPGQTVTVYPTEGMAFAAESPLTATPEGSVTVMPAEDGTLTVTFPETLPLDTEITLTGNLVSIEEPEPEVKPGYRFRLR